MVSSGHENSSSCLHRCKMEVKALEVNVHDHDLAGGEGEDGEEEDGG